jgi:serine/threonine-protein kinase
MAVVYEAEDTSCGRRVAIKVVRPDVASRVAFSADMMRREARALVALHRETEHVVEVITAGVTDDAQHLPYYVMERLEGFTLRAVLDKKRSEKVHLAVDEAIGLVIDLATALDHAHRRSITHLDVKPENVFVHRQRHGSPILKLLDFGISAMLGDTPHRFRGTLRYAAPEQLRGERVSAATDLYALGLVLFESLTLRRPFEGVDDSNDPEALVLAQCEAVPRSVEELRAEVPPALAALVTQCLEKDPAMRPASAAAVVGRLREMQNERGETGAKPYLTGLMLVDAPGSEDPVAADTALDDAGQTGRDGAGAGAGAPDTLQALGGPSAQSEVFVTARVHPSEGTDAPVVSGSSARRSSRLALVRAAIAPRAAAHWRRALVALAALAALGGFGAMWNARGRAHPSSSAPTATSGAETAAPARRAITDHPPPKTSSPEAAAAYAAALQDLRDGLVAVAWDDLLRATTLDPSFAAAHLAIVLRMSLGVSEREQEAFAAASQNRGSLDERGLVLLHAAEALRNDPPDFVGLVAGLRAAEQRFPDDAEILLYLGGALQQSGETEQARETVERALRIDPEFAGAAWLLAATYLKTDLDRAAQAADRCLAISPAAASCLRQRSTVHAERGQCVEFEADSRRMTVVEPTGCGSYISLAEALAARGAPLESVRAARDKAAALKMVVDPVEGKLIQVRTDLDLSALAGDLASTLVAARTLDALAARDTTEGGHWLSVMRQIEVLEEEGDSAKALAVAEAFERRVPGWTANDAGGVRLYLLYARHHAGRLGDGEFRRQRAALEGEASRPGLRSEYKVRNLTPPLAPVVAIEFYSRYAETADEVSDALSRLEDVPSVFVPAEIQAFMGRVYLLAGRMDEAIPLLRRATAACTILLDVVGFMHAHLWLGQALEAKGDKAGACGAYAVILDRWKKAKPRSVTLERAAERARALGCPT